jgi:hypothetical protein
MVNFPENPDSMMTSIHRWVPILLIAWAVSTIPAAPAFAQDSPVLDNTWVDRYHAYIENDLYGTVAWFDRFFEDDLRKDVGPSQSSMRWTNDFRWDQENHFKYRTRVRASIRLSHLMRRWRLVISGENTGDPTAIKPEDPGNPGLDVASQSRRASTELVYDLHQSRNTIVDLGAGVRIKLSPTAYFRARFLHARELAYSIIGRLAVTPFWDTKDGFGESNQVDFERQLAPMTLLRWSNSATITEVSNGWNWGTELSVLQRLSPYSAITFAANATGPTRPSTVVQNYRVYTRYRRNFLRSWLFFELEPDVNWPRQDDGSRKTVLGGTIRLEINFTGRETLPNTP